MLLVHCMYGCVPQNIANYYPHLKSGFSKRALHVKMAEMQFYQLYLKTLTPTIQSV